MALLSGEVETGNCSDLSGNCSDLGSGWLCYPGKLKPHGVGWRLGHLEGVPDGFAIRGS